jgi:hypothetical protein
MQTKTLRQTVTFKASPHEVYDILMDSKKHQSLSGEPAKISKKVGGKFTAWGSHLSGINLRRQRHTPCRGKTRCLLSEHSGASGVR